MNENHSPHAWWSRLRHYGMLLSPVVLVERYPGPPPAARFPLLENLRNDYNRFVSKLADLKENAERDEATILKWVDAILEKYIVCNEGQIAKQHDIRINITAPIRIGNRTETIRPHRVVFADATGTKVALLVMVDTSSQFGRGRERTAYARFLELLRGSGHRLGLLTNGSQFRLIYAGLDFESWTEWESDRWFDSGDGTEELNGLRQLLSPELIKDVTPGISGLLDAVEESRKRQADLSSVLRENVRQAVELLLEDVSTTHRTKSDLFSSLALWERDGVRADGEYQHESLRLTDAEAHEALLQATVRIVMRLVVCLFAESRKLLPVNDPIYDKAYGVRSLYELLEEATRLEGGTHVLFNRQTAWSRLMALFRLIHGGSSHGAFTLRAYGGVLFRPGDDKSTDPVARAMHILEHAVSVGDATIYYVLRKLLRGPLPVIKGRQKTFVEGPVDYTDLRTEFIGLIYEGLLDYRLKRTDEQTGPQIFLNLGREPVLPLSRLQDMMDNDPKSLKDLLTTLKKEKVTASVSSEEEETDEDTEGQEEDKDETTEEPVIETEGAAEEIQRPTDYLDSVEAALNWASKAVVLAGLIGKQTKKETDSEYQTRIEVEAKKLINKVVTVGEFYLVRAGNTRKGTGTFYTRPQLAVPTVHRTLEPLCYTKSPLPLGEGQGEGESDAVITLVPKTPEEILGLKVCDPACGSASFLVAALHYLTEALYKSLCHHRKLDDPSQSKRITIPYGRPKNGNDGDELLPFPPDDPNRGEMFAERVKALLRRHVVERCIYGVDINPLAVEFARVSLWIETLDPELPFSFLDHKIKVGNSLVGCWLDRVEDYPIKAWEREGGDGKNGPRSQRIETFLKGEKIGNKRSGDGRIKKEMRELLQAVADHQAGQSPLLAEIKLTVEATINQARTEYETLHSLPIANPDERERVYREHVQASPALRRLKQAMDEWCAVWFWPADEESLRHVPSPLEFHRSSQQTAAVVERLTAEMRFFHWELEFPEVFTPQRIGFDVVLGNPPWENAQPNPQEFFSEFDPLFRTYGRVQSLRRMTELFETMTGVEESWRDYCGNFKGFANWIAQICDPFGTGKESLLGRSASHLQVKWDSERAKRVGYTFRPHPFKYQQGRVFTYRLFLELSYYITAAKGAVGIIVPSGIYSDSWTQPLRQLFLTNATWEWICGFINWEHIFNIYYRFKFAILVVRKLAPSPEHAIQVVFGRYKVSDWENAERIAFSIPSKTISEFSPKNLALPEIRTERDLQIARRVYQYSFRIGDKVPGWHIDMKTEFMMNTDAKHFPPIEVWREKGYKPNQFGLWVSPDGSVALPLYEGRMIGQFDFADKGYDHGRGRTATWLELPFDNKQIKPQYLVSQDIYASWPKAVRYEKLAFMEIASATNSRSFIGTVFSDLPGNHKVPFISISGDDGLRCLLLCALLNSFAFDYVLRTRLGGLSISWAMLAECPIPKLISAEVEATLQLNATRLAFVHRRFAPQWLRAKSRWLINDRQEWKHLWAVTEADRLRLRIENDALCANLYGLEPDDFDWIVRDDPSDPKGFHRADKHLPFHERLTGLTAPAFRALKEGKWSVETVGKLSNDEFFEIIGIPELTNAMAAHAKGLPDPLILKRDGCHDWKPENFSPDDPRHGWTWDDCWKDAVALLGSEEAVQKYITEKPENKQEEGNEKEEDEEPFRLKADKPRERQKKLF